MKGGRGIVKSINIELFEDELSYILTGLELFSLNLNNIWAVKKDTDEQELRYHVVFYLYQRLLSYSSDFDKYVQIKMPKPKNKFKKVLHFKI